MLRMISTEHKDRSQMTIFAMSKAVIQHPRSLRSVAMKSSFELQSFLMREVATGEMYKSRRAETETLKEMLPETRFQITSLNKIHVFTQTFNESMQRDVINLLILVWSRRQCSRGSIQIELMQSLFLHWLLQTYEGKSLVCLTLS